jgi:hypothetical protein
MVMAGGGGVTVVVGGTVEIEGDDTDEETA